VAAEKKGIFKQQVNKSTILKKQFDSRMQFFQRKTELDTGKYTSIWEEQKRLFPFDVSKKANNLI
jgi:hypothetical protein